MDTIEAPDLKDLQYVPNKAVPLFDPFTANLSPDLGGQTY